MSFPFVARYSPSNKHFTIPAIKCFWTHLLDLLSCQLIMSVNLPHLHLLPHNTFYIPEIYMNVWRHMVGATGPTSPGCTRDPSSSVIYQSRDKSPHPHWPAALYSLGFLRRFIFFHASGSNVLALQTYVRCMLNICEISLRPNKPYRNYLWSAHLATWQ
jgi:hypothetical protein